MPGSISSPAIPRRAAHCVHRVTVPSPSTTSSRSANGVACGSTMSPARPGRASQLASPLSQRDTSTPAAMRTLVISVTSGVDRPEACNQALTVAAAAVAAGVEVSLWLSGEASWLALPGRAGDIVLPHATPLADLLEVVLGEGTVTLCTQCAARRGI